MYMKTYVWGWIRAHPRHNISWDTIKWGGSIHPAIQRSSDPASSIQHPCSHVVFPRGLRANTTVYNLAHMSIDLIWSAAVVKRNTLKCQTLICIAFAFAFGFGFGCGLVCNSRERLVPYFTHASPLLYTI